MKSTFDNNDDDDDLVNNLPKRNHIKKNNPKDNYNALKFAEATRMHSSRRSQDRDSLRKMVKNGYVQDDDED